MRLSVWHMKAEVLGPKQEVGPDNSGGTIANIQEPAPSVREAILCAGNTKAHTKASPTVRNRRAPGVVCGVRIKL